MKQMVENNVYTIHSNKAIKLIFFILLIVYIIINNLKELVIVDPMSSFVRLSKYVILLFAVYFFIWVFIANLKQMNVIFKRYKTLFIHIIAVLFSWPFNINYSTEYLPYVALILMIFCCVLIFKRRFLNIVFICYLLVSIYVAYIVIVKGQIYIGSIRDFGLFQLTRSKAQIEGSQYSIIAYYIGAALILCFILIKQKLLKYACCAVLLILCIILGKSTIVLSLILTVFIFYFIRVRKKWSIGLTLAILVPTFLSAYIIAFVIFPITGYSYGFDAAFNGRITLWYQYIQYIFLNNPLDIFIGNGFFDTAMSNSMFTFHPHNQYLGIMYISGILGFITYFFLWLDAFRLNVQKSYGTQNYKYILLLLFILFIQIGDDYIFFSLEPLFIMCFIYLYTYGGIPENTQISI